VLKALAPIASRWTRVLEPTCGRGSFLEALLEQEVAPRELIGIEIQESNWSMAHALTRTSAGSRLQVLRANLFDLELGNGLPWRRQGPLLVVGNPPWITAAALGRMDSNNVPSKRNLKRLPGIEARTGSSNFDIAEAVWIKLLEELARERPTIALLCKTSAARAVLEFAHRRRLPIADSSIHEIDAARWFGAAVSACLLRVTLGGPPGGRRGIVPIFAAIDSDRPSRALGFHQGRLVADPGAFARHVPAMGSCPLNWRQGIKHDAASVVELVVEGPSRPHRNRLGQEVAVEQQFIFPLLKGADLRKAPENRRRRALIVTQERLGQPTHELEEIAPDLWRYLQSHSTRFASRRSSIYRGQPPFAMFGVGPYSFAPFKVAVAALYRTPIFQAVGPVDGRPVMFDDTCYLLPFESALEAAVVCALCNDPITHGLIRALSFSDAKRPVTKGLLQRIDLAAILIRTDRRELARRTRDVAREHLGIGFLEAAGIEAEFRRLGDAFNESSRRSPEL
jgi:hypothetical protein